MGAERLTKKGSNLLRTLYGKFPNDGLVWELAAKIDHADVHAKVGHIKNAYRCYTKTDNLWAKNPETCLKVLQITEQLCHASLESAAKNPGEKITMSEVSTARLNAQACLRASTVEKWENCADMEIVLSELLTKIQEILLKQ